MIMVRPEEDRDKITRQNTMTEDKNPEQGKGRTCTHMDDAHTWQQITANSNLSIDKQRNMNEVQILESLLLAESILNPNGCLYV